MSKNETEARLLKALAVELEELETLEKFKLIAGPGEIHPGDLPLRGVQVMFETPWAFNPVEVRERMEKAIAQTIAENAKDLVANAVAVQRGIVEDKRQALIAFQTKPLPPPADEKDLDLDSQMAAAPNGNADPLLGQRMDSADVGEEADIDF